MGNRIGTDHSGSFDEVAHATGGTCTLGTGGVAAVAGPVDHEVATHGCEYPSYTSYHPLFCHGFVLPSTMTMHDLFRD